MKCVEAQALITKYINDELQGEQLEEFLEHIEECSDCREELEIYYVIMKGMQQIEDDNVLDYNFHAAFEKQLSDSKKMLAASNKRFIIKMIVLEMIILMIILFLTNDTFSKKEESKSNVKTFNGIVID